MVPKFVASREAVESILERVDMTGKHTNSVVVIPQYHISKRCGSNPDQILFILFKRSPQTLDIKQLKTPQPNLSW